MGRGEPFDGGTTGEGPAPGGAARPGGGEGAGAGRRQGPGGEEADAREEKGAAGGGVSGSDNAIVACYELDGVRYLKNELTQEQWEEISSDTGKWEVVYVERPWVTAAEEELNLKFGLT